MNARKIALIAWTIVFILIGGGLMLYGMSFDPFNWFQGFVTFTEPNDEPIPWGLLVIGYVFFGVMGAGISTYNSLYELFNLNHKENNPFDKIKLRNEWLALAVIIPGIIMVFASAFKPAAAVYIYLSFRDTSRIAWNGVLYVLVGIAIILEIVAMILEKSGKENSLVRLARSLMPAILFYAIATELILDANLGAVFGYLSTWVIEFGALIPILFVAGSLYSGIAAISILTALYSWLSKPHVPAGSGADPNNDKKVIRTLARDGLLVTIAVGFMIMWWMWIASTNPETYPWANLMLYGNWSAVFLGGVVLAGVVLPAFLYYASYRTGNKGLLFVSSILAIVGWFSLVLIVDVVPQAISWYYSVSPVSPPGSTWVYELRSDFNGVQQYSLLPFSVSPYAFVWFLGSTLFFLGVYTLGVLLLPLEEEEKPKRLLIFK
ncbi:MAG: NrfD/PsrC family molybdoenzyme membrane anchor subunit [Thermoprotei archaeon]